MSKKKSIKKKTPKKLTNHLEKHKIVFEMVPHRTVYTGYDLAQTLGEELSKIAKTLLLKIEFPKVQKKKPGYYILAVPASYQADLKKIKKIMKAVKVEMAPARVMSRLGLEPGSISPFASLHGLELLMDRSLAKLQKVLVRAGSHTESLRVKVKDLHKLENPILGSFGVKGKKKAKKKSKRT